MRSSLPTPAQSTGTFEHVATCSFYGTQIDPPLQVQVMYEWHRDRPVFREAVDRRGVKHEIELLNQIELRESFRKAVEANLAITA